MHALLYDYDLKHRQIIATRESLHIGMGLHVYLIYIDYANPLYSRQEP